MRKQLPYWRADGNLIEVDFPKHNNSLEQMAVEIFNTAFPSVLGPVPVNYDPRYYPGEPPEGV